MGEIEFQRLLDACLNLHLLEGGAELRMHQLFASFLLDTPPVAEEAATLQRARLAQARRKVKLGEELGANPAEAGWV